MRHQLGWRRSLHAAIRSLKTDEASLGKELSQVQKKIRDLEELSRAEGSNGRANARKTGPRRLSAKGRAAISRAAKKRWAEYRREQRAAAR